MFKLNKLFIFTLALFIVIAGVLGTKPAYRKFKDIRASYLSDEAYDVYIADPMSRSAMTNATRKAQSALFLSPSNYKANRTLAVLSMFIDPGISLKYWNQSRLLARIPEDIPLEDKMNYIQTLLISGKLDRAYEVLQSIEGGEEVKSDVDYNLAKICYLQGNKEEAVKYGRSMVKNRFTPIDQHLFFASMCLESLDPVIIREGERHLRILFENDELMEDSVLWEMTQLKNLSPELSILLKDKLYSRVNVFEERIALAEYQIQNNMKEASLAYQELKLEVNKRDFLAVATLAKWCSKHNMVDETLEMLTPELALKRKDWFLLYLKNLGKKHRWEDVIELLAIRDCPIEAFWSYIMKAEAFHQIGEESKAINAWYRAKLESSPTKDSYWLMIKMGDEFGLEEDTNRMLTELVIIGVKPEQVLAYVTVREFSRKNYDGFYSFLESFKDHFFDHDDIVNDWAYYSILMNRNVELALSIITKLVENNPKQLRYHMTWALAEIKEGRYRQVLGRFQQFEIDWMNLHPKWRFILSLALAGVGEFDQAEAYLEGIELQSFNPFELELYEKLFYDR